MSIKNILCSSIEEEQMISYIVNLLKSKGRNIFILQTLLLLGFIYILILIIKKRKPVLHETFKQNERFVLKLDSNIYDNFYCKIHDDIHQPSQHIDFELIQIAKITQPSKQSVFLDIGSGTGDLVNELTDAGYYAYGIDKSKAMVDVATKKYPEVEYKCGDALKSMNYETNTFTHIICNYFTIYEIEDKRTLFRNCYFWLKSNGYLILHLVEPKKFDPITPIAKPRLDENPQELVDERITSTIIDFKEMEYKSEYKFDNVEKGVVVVKETFKDKGSEKIRQNEQTLFMDSINKILNITEQNGFIVHSKINMKSCIDDENQYIYILEKIQSNLHMN